MKHIKKTISILIAAIMLLSMVPVFSIAADVVGSGTCGANLTWTLDSDGTLTIGGTGDMDDWDEDDSSLPWYSYSTVINSVRIEEGVTNIGSNAFWGCDNLNSISIPNTVTCIGYGVFGWCSNLKDIIIPDSVTIIEENAFHHSGLTSVRIPAGVKQLSEGMFAYCVLLTYVIIPDGVTSIEEAAFSACGNLTNLTIPDSVKRVGVAAFENCISLTSVTIPNGVTSIEKDTFAWCKGLESVTISGSVTSIDDAAFFACSNLKDVYYRSSCKFNWSDITVGKDNEPLLNATLHLLDHTPGEVVKENEVAPTCTAAGSYDDVTYCTVCGDEASRVTVTVDALGHIDEANDGLCDRCGEKMTGDGHCGYCGKIHEGFPEVLVGWVHTVLNLFKTTKPEDAINTANEGAQDGAKLFQSIMNAGTDFASEFAKAVDGIQKTLIPLVEYFGKITAMLQSGT